VRQLEQLIPHREDVPRLIYQITERAMDSGVELAVIRPGSEEAGDFYSRQTFELQVLGEYHSIAEYLTAIGSLSRIVRPHELKLSVETPRPDGEKSPTLRAAFRIEVYVMPDAAIESTTEPREDQCEHLISCVCRCWRSFAAPHQRPHNRRRPERPVANTSEPRSSSSARCSTTPAACAARPVPAADRRSRRAAVHGPDAAHDPLLRGPGESVVAVSDAAKKQYRLRRGDTVGNATVVDIGPTRVVFSVLTSAFADRKSWT
jgi:hypothetical protein